MKEDKMQKNTKNSMLYIALTALLTGCGGFSLSNPFGSGQSSGNTPYQGATHYICAENKQFYVRMLSNNQEAWLIYPDHEVSLKQAENEKNRYTSGLISLVINGKETTLNDGDKVAYRACQPQK
jgi:membrane-bound inhibitor of C-type lysozyme